MHSPETLTIDVTVARDFLDASRERHSSATKLFKFFRAGEVDLVTAPQGYALDVQGDLAEQLRAVLGEEQVREAPQLAYPSAVTFPSENLFPGAYVEGFGKAWGRIAASRPESNRWPPRLPDRYHVETHVHQGRNVFVTDDQPLLEMCQRLKEDEGIPIVAMGLVEYVESRSGSRP
jgi:hypothetical protein